MLIFIKHSKSMEKQTIKCKNENSVGTLSSNLHFYYFLHVSRIYKIKEHHQIIQTLVSTDLIVN